jgi:hypothetical protein
MIRLLCLLVLLLSPCALAETLTAQRADGTEIVYYLDRPTGPRYPLAVILQGSECLRVSDKFGAWVSLLNASGIAVLRVEKPGLRADTPIGTCPEEYLRLNTVERRVLDLLTVLAQVRRQESGWDGRLGLSGGSEGSMVAAISAPLLPETRCLLLLSSGGGSDFGAEVKASIAAQMRASGASEEAVIGRLSGVDDEWKEIARQPIPSREWASDGKLARNTYMWWDNALRKAIYRPLLDVSAPIRVYQGRGDTSMVASGSTRLLERFDEARRTNLELVEYEGEHVPPPEVLQEAFGWLAQQLK